MNPSTSNRLTSDYGCYSNFDRYFHVHSQAYPGYKGIDCACLRIHKHPDIKKAFDCASPQSYIRFWPNLAIVKNRKLPRYCSPAVNISVADCLIVCLWRQNFKRYIYALCKCNRLAFRLGHKLYYGRPQNSVKTRNFNMKVGAGVRAWGKYW